MKESKKEWKEKIRQQITGIQEKDKREEWRRKECREDVQEKDKAGRTKG